MKLQDRVARRKRQEEEEKERIAAEEEELQIAIEEQHGANPLYTQSNPRCQGAATAEFDFQASFLPKDVFAFGFAEPVSSEGGNGFLQVDRQAFVQVSKLQLMPNGGSDRKLNVYGLTLSFNCGNLPSSDFGGGDVRIVRILVHYAIADIFFVSSGMENKDSRTYSHEFKLEKGEHLTDIVATEVSGVGIFGVYFKTSLGRSSDRYDGDEMEYVDSDDCSTRTWSARKGQMISGIKLNANDGACRIQGITQKQLSQSGKAEAPSDRLTLVSLSRAKGDVDMYEATGGGRAGGAAGAAGAQEPGEAPVGCEIFIWKNGQIAPEGLQAPDERLPTVDESALQGRWELSFEGTPPPGAEGHIWQLTLSVESAGRVQGEGTCLKRKKPGLIEAGKGKKGKAKEAKEAKEAEEANEKTEEEKEAEEAEDKEDEDGDGEGGDEEEKEEEEKEDEDEEDEEEGCGDEEEEEEEEMKELKKDKVDEAFHPMIDKLIEMKSILESYDGDLAQVIKVKKEFRALMKALHKDKKTRYMIEDVYDELTIYAHLNWVEEKEQELGIDETVSEFVDCYDSDDDDESSECSDDYYEDDYDERPVKVKKNKGLKLATLRSEGWLVSKAVSLDVFVTPPETKPEKKAEEGGSSDSEPEEKKEEEEEEDPTQHYLLDGAITDESESSAALRGEWRGASTGADGEVLRGSWTAVRVVDESPRIVGLWRVSVGMQDGAPVYAWTMWLTVRFAVESRSGALHGALLEGPGLNEASVPRPSVEGKLTGRSLRLQITGWQGRAELDGVLDKAASGVLRGVWWSAEKGEASGSWEANRLDPFTITKLMEPRVLGEEPLVTTVNDGSRIHADGLKSKGKPLCPDDHPLIWTDEDNDYYDGDDDWCCAKCENEQSGFRWKCGRCEYDVCKRCEKAQPSAQVGDGEQEKDLGPKEFALLDRFKVTGGKRYFEVSVEKLGEDAMIGWVLEDQCEEYAPGDEPASWLWHCKGFSRQAGKDTEGVVGKWVENCVLGLAIDNEAGAIYAATTEAPQLQKVFEFDSGLLPEGKPVLAMLTPGDKGTIVVNVGQSPFQLHPPEDVGFRPLAELVALRRQWRVTLPTSVESWPVFVEPKRTADGAASLGPKDTFEELAEHEEAGTRWVRHARGWSPVSLDAAGQTCEGLAALPSVVDALEKRGDPNGFKHFRLAVTKVRGGDTTRGVHVGQLLLRRDGVLLELGDAQASCPDGQCNDNEGPDMAVDGRGNTKWHTSVLSPLVISLQKPTIIDSFTFQTAFDGEQYDPVEWRFEASNDLSNWQPLHTQETEYRTPRRRCTQAAWFAVSGKAKAKSKATGWNSGAKVKAGLWHALTMSVDLPRGKLCIWLDGEVALEVVDASHPLLRCDGPLSLDPKEGLCLFGRTPLLKKEWGWMMGAQVRRLQLQTRPPDRFNVWSLQMPMGVWICRAKSVCRTQGLFTRNPASTSSCWRCKSQRVRSAFRPPNDANPRHPGLTIFTAEAFEELLEKRQHIFLAVSADWCGACQQLKPVWYALAELLRLQEEVTIGVLDIDENDVDRRYFPEKHIPVLKLLKKKPDAEAEEGERRPVVAYEGERSLPALLQFVTEHTGVVLEDVLKANYKVYEKAHGIVDLLERMKRAAREALRGRWGNFQVSSGNRQIGGSSPESWRRLCAFLCAYCLDPEHFDDVAGKQDAKGEEAQELWITLLLGRLEGTVAKVLEVAQPGEPVAFLLHEVFLPGARPEAMDAVRKGLQETGPSGEGLSRKWSHRWSAVAQQKASTRAEPMAMPMLQRSWAKVHVALDARSPGRIQVLRELMRRGLDLDFLQLGREQPSVLWLAAANDDGEVLRFCLACGADPHREANGLLPIEVAASTGAVLAVTLLLRSGAVAGRALHFAAASAQLGVLRVLLDLGVDPGLRVNGLSATAVAAAVGHAEAVKALTAHPRALDSPVAGRAFEALSLTESHGYGALQLAAQAAHERTCEVLLRANGLTAAPAEIAEFAPDSVRAVLEPQRLALFAALAGPSGQGKGLAEAFGPALEAVPKATLADARAPLLAGAGPLRPEVLSALLDDAEAVALLQGAAPAAPSALMWAQWAGAQAVAGALLGAGAAPSNADLEGLRRLGRARRVAEEAGGVGARLLAPDGWEGLREAAARLAVEETLAWRFSGLRGRMAWQGPSGSTAAPLAAAEEAVEGGPDPLEVAAEAVVDLLGKERFAITRFLVQREIARGGSRATLAPLQILALEAAARDAEVHARCGEWMPLLQAALQALPVCRGPCYRSLAGSMQDLLLDYKPGSVVQWPTGTAGTVDFDAAVAAIDPSAAVAEGSAAQASPTAPSGQALNVGARGVVFKVRRVLTGREVTSEGSEVLFLGGALRVAGLFALAGPLLSAERQLASGARPTADRLARLGPWSAPLDMVRRPRALEHSEALREPLVLVLLDEEESA